MKCWEKSILSAKSFRVTFSQLLFIMILIPLSIVLKGIDCGYQFSNGGIKVHHLLFMDDLELWENREKIELVIKYSSYLLGRH